MGLSSILLAVLVTTIAITVHTMRERRTLSANYSAALELASHSSALRLGASELFTWQIANTLAVLEQRPGALADTDPARIQYERALRELETALGTVEAGPLDETERSELANARSALAGLGRIDDVVRADYGSGEAQRVRDAARTATTTGIDQFQAVSRSLSQLAMLLDERAGRLGDENEAVGMRVQLLVVVLAAIMICALIGLLAWAWQDDRHKQAMIEQLADEATMDPLTEVANRRRWDLALAEALRRARHDGTPFTVVLIDLDHFKRFNDTYGHPAGDRHLRAVARLCTEALRRDDLVARLGGEEFGLLLNGSAAIDATRVVERMRPQMPAGETFSAGIAEWNGTESAGELVARADRALYGAKAAGRNCLELSAR